MSTPVVLYEQEYEQLKNVITRLCADANAKFVFLVDKNGQQIAAHGEMLNLDTTSLATLTAGNVANRVILVVIFDERSSLGLVRLRVKRATAEMNSIFEAIDHKVDREREM